MFQLLAIACSQTRLFPLFIFTHLTVSRTPSAAWLGSVYRLLSIQEEPKRQLPRYLPHLTFLCLHNSHLMLSVRISDLGELVSNVELLLVSATTCEERTTDTYPHFRKRRNGKALTKPSRAVSSLSRAMLESPSSAAQSRTRQLTTLHLGFGLGRSFPHLAGNARLL